MDFAQALSAFMAERGISGNSLASRVHCDKALISRFVNGKQQPSAKLARLLDEALGAGGALIRAAATPGTAAPDPGGVLAAFGVAPGSFPAAGELRPVAPELVDYFRTQLAGHYRADMFLGPHHLIPTVTEQHRLICDLAGMAAGGVRAAAAGGDGLRGADRVASPGRGRHPAVGVLAFGDPRHGAPLRRP